MRSEYPQPHQIETFNKLLDEGWSVTYAMSKSRITGIQYGNFINNCPSAKARIDHYKNVKKRYNKCYFGGTPLSMSQHLELGIEYRRRDHDDEALARFREIERTKINIECLETGIDMLPRGK